MVNSFNFPFINLCKPCGPSHPIQWNPGADPGFLEREFIYIMVGGCFDDFISIFWNIPWKWNNLVGGCFDDFISFFLNIPWKWNNLVSLRPNYFISIGYFKIGVQGRGFKRTPWTPSGSTTEIDLHSTVLYFMSWASFLSVSCSFTSGISSDDLASKASSDSLADVIVFFSSWI